MPADFASKEAEELDGVDFYKQLKKVRDAIYTPRPYITQEMTARLPRHSRRPRSSWSDKTDTSRR